MKLLHMTRGHGQLLVTKKVNGKKYALKFCKCAVNVVFFEIKNQNWSHLMFGPHRYVYIILFGLILNKCMTQFLGKVPFLDLDWNSQLVKPLATIAATGMNSSHADYKNTLDSNLYIITYCSNRKFIKHSRHFAPGICNIIFFTNLFANHLTQHGTKW